MFALSRVAALRDPKTWPCFLTQGSVALSPYHVQRDCGRCSRDIKSVTVGPPELLLLIGVTFKASKGKPLSPNLLQLVDTPGCKDDLWKTRKLSRRGACRKNAAKQKRGKSKIRETEGKKSSRKGAKQQRRPDMSILKHLSKTAQRTLTCRESGNRGAKLQGIQCETCLQVRKEDPQRQRSRGEDEKDEDTEDIHIEGRPTRKRSTPGETKQKDEGDKEGDQQETLSLASVQE